MTLKELKERLSHLDENLEVMTYTEDGWFGCMGYTSSITVGQHLGVDVALIYGTEIEQ